VGLFGQGNAATVKGRCVVHVATEGGGEEGNDGEELCSVDYEFECSGAQEVEYVDFDEPTVRVCHRGIQKHTCVYVCIP
jgi:hypothetical protein